MTGMEGLGLSGDDSEIVMACVDLIGRAGARGFEIGFLHDDVPTAQAGWYAHAQYRGARITEEGAGPVEVADALARRILKGAQCRCGKLVRLAGDDSAFAFLRAPMADGTTWTAQQAAAAGQCTWSRNGPRWDPSCPEPANRTPRERL